ncbi:hypothetical protein L3X38_042038 [Prunus dulcis]|uniref:Uncharacterized protein n=1 Tax=Prunus dulcis TaxID=3755 RepID=A0AAD4YL76_PRUDU|nr:hypothetical protein L3X38_042038 [Prunus dulcis]
MGGMCSKSRRSTVDDVTVNNAPSGSIPTANGHSSNGSRDDVNDGIPHLSRALSQKNRSTKSKQAVAKVSEVSSLFG